MKFPFFNFRKKEQTNKSDEKADREKVFREITEKYQVAEAVEKAEKMLVDIRDRIVPYREDGTSGNATGYNYLRTVEGISASEAVDAYLDVKNVLHGDELKKLGNLIIFDYASYLDKSSRSEIIGLWLWSRTFLYINDSNLPESQEELEALCQQCRENGIHLVKGNYSLTEDKYFHISSQSYPGSADDAATYVEYSIHWTDQ